MKVEIANQTKSRLDERRIRRICELFLRRQRLEDKELSVAFIGDIRMRGLNKQYRGKDKPTDILSFAGEGDFLGEILIDYQQIKRQAGKFGQTERAELEFILVHGLLHLIGYDDDTENDRLEMIRLGKEFLAKIDN